MYVGNAISGRVYVGNAISGRGSRKSYAIALKVSTSSNERFRFSRDPIRV